MGVAVTEYGHDECTDTKEPTEFEKVRHFFFASEWNAMSFYDKWSFVKIVKDLKRMKKAGLSLQLLGRFILRLEFPQWMDQWKLDLRLDDEWNWIPSLFLHDDIEIKDAFDQAADFLCDEKAVSAPAMSPNHLAAWSPIKTRRGASLAPPPDLKLAVSVPDALHQGPLDIQTSSSDVSIEHDCEGCDGEWRGEEGCPLHGPLQMVLDTEVPLGQPDRALRTLPPQLAVLPSKIPGAGLGVCSTEDLPAMLRFGPYEGEVTAKDQQSGYAWNIVVPGGPDHFLDGEDVTKSNWMRYVNCARNIGEQNLHAFQHAGCVYYRTVRPVPAHTELLVWYGDSYAQDLGIDSARPKPPSPAEEAPGAPGHCDDSADGTLRTVGHCEGFGDANLGSDGRSRISRALKRRHSHCVSRPPSPPETALKRAKYSESTQLPCSAKSAAPQPPRQLRSGRVSVPTKRLQVGHQKKIKTPSCRTCYAAFRSLRALRAHERGHPTFCRVCEAHFEDGAAFKRHLRVHPDAAEFKCEDCDTPFKSQDGLRSHRCRHILLKKYHGSLYESFDTLTEDELSQDGDARRRTSTPCGAEHGDTLQPREDKRDEGVVGSTASLGDLPQDAEESLSVVEDPGPSERGEVLANEGLSEMTDVGDDPQPSECAEEPTDESLCVSPDLGEDRGEDPRPAACAPCAVRPITDEDAVEEPHRCLRCTARFAHIEDLRTHFSSHRRVLAEKNQRREEKRNKKEEEKREDEDDEKERKRIEDGEKWWRRIEKEQKREAKERKREEKKIEREKLGEKKKRQTKAKGRWRPVTCNRCVGSTKTFATREAFLKHILESHYWFAEKIRKEEKKRWDERRKRKEEEKNRREEKILEDLATKMRKEKKKRKKKKKEKKGEMSWWRPVACNRCGEDTETFLTRRAYLKHILQAHRSADSFEVHLVD
ncbi:uncharacterized protein LOC117650522 [Thrips palmi]|uniref:Uncharacterized protein LOC117650522 n=1 Tax=Thrips palmi TaxID=161013 RepID=A0A6P8ZWY1_THRPL|nr:uncharacterized protein LOC117650522 [Thrips palmi]